MATIRTIKAPGVEVNEIDLSQYSLRYDFSDTTMVMLNGFSDRGEDYMTDVVTSIKGFTDKFGTPTNEAERYLYNAVKETIRGGGVGVVSKLPYNNNSFEKYTYVRYFLDSGDKQVKLSDYRIEKNLEALSTYVVLGGGKAEALKDFDIRTNPVVSRFWNYIRDIGNLGSRSAEVSNKAYELFYTTGFWDGLKSVYDDHTNPDVETIILGRATTRFIMDEPDGGLVVASDGGEEVSLYEMSDKPAPAPDPEPDPGEVTILGKIKQILVEAEAGNTIDEFRDKYFGQLTLDDIDTFVNYVCSMTGAERPEEDLEVLYTNAKYCELAKEDSLTSFVRISCDTKEYGPEKNYLDYDHFDDMLIGNKAYLDENEIAIVDITKTRYEKDKRLDGIYKEEGAEEEKRCYGEYVGVLPVLVGAANALVAQRVIAQSKRGFGDTYNVISSLVPIHRKIRVPASEDEPVWEDDYEELVRRVNENEKLQVFSMPIRSEDPDIETVGTYAAETFPSIDRTGSDSLDETYLKQVGLVVFRMYIDNSNYGRIRFVPVESYVGSLDREAKDPITGASIFIDNVVNRVSETIRVFTNCNFKDSASSNYRSSTFLVENQPAVSLGFYEADNDKSISVDMLMEGLDVIFKKLENPNMLKLDLLADAGISNIAQNIRSTSRFGSGYYDVEKKYNYKIINRHSLAEWQKVLDKYAYFCGTTRKDLMFISDSPRNLALQGEYKLVSRGTRAIRTIKKDIAPNVKYMTSSNTSYGAGYATWLLGVDDTSKGYIWLPPSVKALEAYLVSDRDYNFWSAPAGLARGRMNRVYDVSFNPTEQDAETFYVNRWNYCVSYPADGIILEGQKTFQREATAFDRVNVRRLFLKVEKDIKKMAKGIVYEQFSETMMSNFRDRINSYLSNIQTNDGIREFYVICDRRNNTDETIDRNELHCTIGIKPTKTIEFVVLNFVCTNQSANIEEVTERNA